jgi:hypothetical protein
MAAVVVMVTAELAATVEPALMEVGVAVEVAVEVAVVVRRRQLRWRHRPCTAAVTPSPR